VTRVLITGMSGAGKSTLLAELARRGHRTVDTDYDGWTGPDGRWDEPRMAALLSGPGDLVVSGTVPNQGRFYGRFAHVVLLTAPLATLLERVEARAGNPYGKKPEQRAEIARYVTEVEPLLRAGAGVVLDGRQAVGALGDTVERLLGGAGAGQ
jgi:shikimate kinase